MVSLFFVSGATACNVDDKVLNDSQNSGVKSCCGRLIPSIPSISVGSAGGLKPVNTLCLLIAPRVEDKINFLRGGEVDRIWLDGSF